MKKTYENPVRARKVRFYPDTAQKKKLNLWFGALRFCYNKLVETNNYVGQGGVDLASMRAVIRAAEKEHPWLIAIVDKDTKKAVEESKVPEGLRDVAIRDYDKARKAHFAKLKKSPDAALRGAKFKFRTKKDAQESFEVRPRDMIHEGGMYAILGLSRLKAVEKLPTTVECAVRFVRDRLGRFYLIVPRQVPKKSENQALQRHESVISLDPGVRTFQTTYDATGLTTEWGKGDMSAIFELCRGADRAQADMAKKKGRKKRGAKRAWLRLLDGIKNKVKEIHRKLAKWLCENYEVILIPTFESSRMVRKADRKIRSKTVRSMLTWSHYGFRQLLKDKAELYPWVKVVECEEPYTSKTCGQCGVINTTLGGSKVFKCKACHYVADRDINAARNILLRYLSLFCGKMA